MSDQPSGTQDGGEQEASTGVDLPADPAVTYEVADEVATISLNRPEQRNILTAESMAELSAALVTADADPAVRVVVLTGVGPAFCAGADLRGASAADAGSFAQQGPAALVGLLEQLLDFDKPTIARVQGHVAGGGNGLVAACDVAVAAEEAKFAFSEVRVGVAPAVISVPCLRKMSTADAYELLLTGERVSAARVQQAGLVNRVAPADELDAAVGEYVRQLRQGGPMALAWTKELLRRVPSMPRDEAFAWTSEMSARLFSSDEAKAGMQAFLGRQPAPWAPAEGS